MGVSETATQFTAALKAGDFPRAEALWADDVVSIEAMDGPMKEARGREAVHAKGEWWTANHDVHDFVVTGPFLNGEQFALGFKIDVTIKETGERRQMDEVGLYTVRGDKIVEERFFY